MAFNMIHLRGDWQWHVNSKKPNVVVDDIFSLQADGDEMFHILNLFSIKCLDGSSALTIPFSRANVQRWHGDIAKTIFDALD